MGNDGIFPSEVSIDSPVLATGGSTVDLQMPPSGQLKHRSPHGNHGNRKLGTPKSEQKPRKNGV